MTIVPIWTKLAEEASTEEETDESGLMTLKQ